MSRWLCLALALLAVALAPSTAAGALPAVRIQAPRAIPDEPKITARMRMPGYRGLIGIERRGHTSQRLYPKKSYGIELRDRRGDDRRVPLLGMPADGDWVLYAPYGDKSLMRNVVAYETARAIGRYAARSRFVDLYINGRYQGVYVLMERLELGAERVQGETLLEFTFAAQVRGEPSFRTRLRKRPVLWSDPDRSDLSRAEARAIIDRVNAAEAALYGPGSWRPHIDEPAAIDYALLQELFKNQDAFHGSTFLTVGADGMLSYGPIWDFDISMGNSDGAVSGRLPGWMAAQRAWASRLYNTPSFSRRLAQRWRELRAAGLQRQVLAIVARSERTLHGSVARNFRRWPILNRRVWPNPRARGSYAAELRFLRSWLRRRMAWIDANVDRLTADTGPKRPRGGG